MNYLVIGGAGFIGSHIVKRLAKEEAEAGITVFDNFSSGKIDHLGRLADKNNVRIVTGDIKNIDDLIDAMRGSDIVYSVASNPDIARAVREPDIDFWEGTYLINNVVEAMRRTGTKRLLYSSGSGVYGDVGETVTDEDFSPMLPNSTYGASKLACEALICAYCHMFDLNAAAFRFANVVGDHQTHGVGYDFLRRLKQDPSQLQILGNGLQSKSYIHVEDIVDALRTVERHNAGGYEYYNVATLDHLTVREIAQMSVEVMNLSHVAYHYTGGDRGWKGDVPIVRLDSKKLRALGWENKYTSKEAMRRSLGAMREEIMS